MRQNSIVSIFAIIILPIVSAHASWDSINMKLVQSGKLFMAYQDLEAVPQLRDIITSTNTLFFVEMTAQKQFPLVAVTGFLWLSAHASTNQAYSAALRLLIAAEATGSPIYLPAYTFLTNGIGSNAFRSILDNVVQCGVQDSKVQPIVVSQMPYDLLFDWFHARERSAGLPSWEAVILDRIYRDIAKHGYQVSDRLKSSVKMYQGIPGYPLLTYLLHSPVDDREFLVTLKQALMDDGIENAQLAVLISNRREFIRKNVDISQLKLSDNRRAVLSKALQQNPVRK